MRIVVGTSVAKYWKWPGATDCRMAYVVGLKKLGHEVWLFDDSVKHCFDDAHNEVPFREWEGLARFEEIARRYEIWPNVCVVYRNGEATHGMSMSHAASIAKSADLLININGKLKHPDLAEPVPVRAFVDEQPGHTQVYEFEYKIDQGTGRHHHFFTLGLNIGHPTCPIPTGGLKWNHFPIPVVLDHWPAAAPSESGRRFTTISNWSGEPTFKLGGKYSGEKSENWLRFVDLPRRTAQPLEIALNINPGYAEDIAKLSSNGWILTDPAALRTQTDYRQYLARSRAEFSVANNRYAEFRTGWVSDRTARYLASGRPVLVQSTRADTYLPVGRGLVTFETLEEAVQQIDAINGDHAGHCRAAREIAEAHFDSAKVFADLFKVCGLN